MRPILIKIHLWLGLIAGAVLCVIAVTGALYAYEVEVRKWFGEPVTLPSEGHPLLSPWELEDRLREQGYVGSATWFRWSGEPDLPARVGWRNSAGEAFPVTVDPVTGAVLPRAGMVYNFFSLVLDIHRTLTLGEAGRLIVGASTIALVFVCVSGIFISVRRWRDGLQVFFPKRREWRLRAPRPRWRLWHRFLGAWATPWLALIALSGLVWSFDWYANAIKWLGGPPRFDTAPLLATPVSDSPLARGVIWARCLQARTGDGAMRLILPSTPGQPVRFEWSPPGAFSSASRSRLFLHPTTGEVVAEQPLENFTPGERVVRWAFPIHTGRAAGLAGQTLAMLVSLAVPFFFGSGLYLYLTRRQKAGRALVLSQISNESAYTPITHADLPDHAYRGHSRDPSRTDRERVGSPEGTGF